MFDDFKLTEINQYSDTISVFFENNRHLLSENQKNLIKQSFKKHKTIDSITIVSYANELGDSAYNKNLSDKRNESVKLELDRLKCKALIKSISNGDLFSKDKSHEYYRRVDLIYHYSSKSESNISVTTVKFDSALMLQLKQLEFSDQDVRIRADSLFRMNPKDTVVLKLLETEMIKSDSINLMKIVKILDKYGYPGLSMVSADYMNVAFILLQHAPFKTREKYFPLILKACDEGEMDKTLLPMMIDRNNLDKGKKQIYGTQLSWNEKLKKFELYPVEDLKKINELRREYCLGPIEDYLKKINSSSDNK